jgi:hypothetical protein
MAGKRHLPIVSVRILKMAICHSPFEKAQEKPTNTKTCEVLNETHALGTN